MNRQAGIGNRPASCHHHSQSKSIQNKTGFLIPAVYVCALEYEVYKFSHERTHVHGDNSGVWVEPHKNRTLTISLIGKLLRGSTSMLDVTLLPSALWISAQDNRHSPDYRLLPFLARAATGQAVYIRIHGHMHMCICVWPFRCERPTNQAQFIEGTLRRSRGFSGLLLHWCSCRFVSRMSLSPGIVLLRDHDSQGLRDHVSIRPISRVWIEAGALPPPKPPCHGILERVCVRNTQADAITPGTPPSPSLPTYPYLLFGRH